MEAEKCGSCFYSVAAYSGGECHRNPPESLVVRTIEGKKIKTIWPAVQENDWCGEWLPVTKKEDYNV